MILIRRKTSEYLVDLGQAAKFYISDIFTKVSIIKVSLKMALLNRRKIYLYQHNITI